MIIHGYSEVLPIHVQPDIMYRPGVNGKRYQTGVAQALMVE